MLEVDLGIAWKWEYDNDFVHILNEESIQNNIQSYIIHKYNLQETKDKIDSGAIKFHSFLDRASDEDKDFIPLIESIKGKFHQCWFLNDSYHSTKSSDKSIMHFELAESGINVPHTIIIPSFQEKPEIDLNDIGEKIGLPFIIKPALTSGGGIGVIKNAQAETDIECARKSNPAISYLLQQQISPAFLDGKRAWFRAYYVLGNVLVCWWDDQTHIYNRLSMEDENRFNLHELRTLTRSIARISRLEFFSTEIALEQSGRFIVIDYINDICDMRLKSRHFDGVPDDVVFEIAGIIVKGVKNKECTVEGVEGRVEVTMVPSSAEHFGRIEGIEKAEKDMGAGKVEDAVMEHHCLSMSRLKNLICGYKKDLAGRLPFLFRRKG
ncbi:hypothetical protein JXL19_03995 [bacterium]|nr:hypothetical protein [bacterium]